MKEKIIHLSNPIGGNKGGGISAVVKDLMTHQNHENFDIELWFPGDENLEYELRDFANYKKRVKVLKFYGSSNDSLLCVWDIFKNIKNVDIIHQHSIWLFPSIISMIFRKKYRGKTIIQPHGALSPTSLKRSIIKKKIAGFLFEYKNLKNASIFIATSQKEVNDIKKLFPSKPVALIPHGVSKSFLNYPTLNNQKFNEIIGTKRAILFLSRVHPIKGIERLIKAASLLNPARLKNVIFIIAGYGERHYVNRLKQEVKKLNLSEHFTFTGHANFEDKIALLDKCSCFILPSYTESFSISIVEAMARSIPVITTKGTPWEIIAENKCGFWVDNNIDGIIEGINQYLDLTDSEAREYGLRAYNLVASDYILEHNIQKYEVLYEYLLRGESNTSSFIY